MYRDWLKGMPFFSNSKARPLGQAIPLSKRRKKILPTTHNTFSRIGSEILGQVIPKGIIDFGGIHSNKIRFESDFKCRAIQI